jgi:hypothetical protein
VRTHLYVLSGYSEEGKGKGCSMKYDQKKATCGGRLFWKTKLVADARPFFVNTPKAATSILSAASRVPWNVNPLILQTGAIQAI